MSPLTKRFPRELKGNFSKYLGIFLMMIIAISLTSGFLMAASSIEKIIHKMDDAYLIEDARFTSNFEATAGELSTAAEAAEAAEAGKTRIYQSYCYDVSFASAGAPAGSTARVYQERTNVNLAAYDQGRAPQAANEVAIDRVFADNANVQVGDTVQVDGADFVVSGIMTLPDYSALFEKNSDFVFNAVSFTVATMTHEAFATLGTSHTPTYTYSIRFDNRDLTDIDRANAEEDMAERLSDEGVVLTDFIDKDANQGIGYPLDDIEGDSSMWTILMLMLIAIMAFMFVVLTSSTIEEESAIIGTLMASGWRKSELIRHYLALPALVGTLAAAVGNMLGYTLMAEPMKNLYYNSYSLPPYTASWDWEVFLLTTAAPVALLIGITFVGLLRKMRCAPLQFLRHETSKGKGKHGVALPEKMSFPIRFRLRVFLRNIGNFVTLFFGIAFASMLLLFGLCIMPTMTHYAESLAEDVPAQHLYTLKTPLEIDGTDSERAAWAAAQKMSSARNVADLGMTPAQLIDSLVKMKSIDEDAHPVNTKKNSATAIAQAEKYAVTSLDFERPGNAGTESVTVYGVQPDSAYWTGLGLSEGQMAASGGMFEKFGLSEGQAISLTDKYEGETYDLAIDARYGSDCSMALYLPINDFNLLFDNDDDYFNGYASNIELNLDELYLSSDLTPESMDKIAIQMTNSMGNMTSMLLGLAVSIFLVFMYLLTKTVIDRSSRAISYMKVFGYADHEIDRLYIRSITWTVVGSLLISLPLIVAMLTAVFKAMLMEYGGNIVIYTPTDKLVLCVAVGIATYAVIAFLHTRRIKRVPLALALKVQE